MDQFNFPDWIREQARTVLGSTQCKLDRKCYLLVEWHTRYQPEPHQSPCHLNASPIFFGDVVERLRCVETVAVVAFNQFCLGGVFLAVEITTEIFSRPVMDDPHGVILIAVYREFK